MKLVAPLKYLMAIGTSSKDGQLKIYYVNFLSTNVAFYKILIAGVSAPSTVSGLVRTLKTQTFLAQN